MLLAGSCVVAAAGDGFIRVGAKMILARLLLRARPHIRAIKSGFIGECDQGVRVIKIALIGEIGVKPSLGEAQQGWLVRFQQAAKPHQMNRAQGVVCRRKIHRNPSQRSPVI